MKKITVPFIVIVMLIFAFDCDKKPSERNVIRDARVIDIIYPLCRSGRVTTWMIVSIEDSSGIPDTLYALCIEEYDHMLSVGYYYNFYYNIEKFTGVTRYCTVDLPSAKVVHKIEPVERNAILHFFSQMIK